MKICSVTIANNRQYVIARMVASLKDHVDEIIILDTGITDATVEWARAAAGDTPVKIVPFSWRNDFSAARNAALQAGADAGAAWALMVDTDEWIEFDGEDLRAQIAKAESQNIRHLLMRHMTGIYVQPRVFKLPASGVFEGPTHEAYGNWAPGLTLEKTRFYDAPKTAEEQKVKLLRDETILRRHLKHKENQNNPRWYYYLGDTLYNLHQVRQAISMFAKCSSMQGWDEQGAWSAYREAACWLELAKESKEPKDCYNKFQKAREACARGLAIHPGVSELAWLAAFVSHEMGQQAQAVCWAKMSAALGKYEGIGKFINRISFTYPMAQWELPFQVLESSYRALGEPAEADKARVKFEIAKKYREAAKEQ